MNEDVGMQEAFSSVHESDKEQKHKEKWRDAEGRANYDDKEEGRMILGRAVMPRAEYHF